MKYFYEYKYKNGNKVGGHNLKEIQIYEDCIIIKGIDIIPTIEDYKYDYWVQRIDMTNNDLIFYNNGFECDECFITFELLQAINKQVEELGWNDEN